MFPEAGSRKCSRWTYGKNSQGYLMSLSNPWCHSLRATNSFLRHIQMYRTTLKCSSVRGIWLWCDFTSTWVPQPQLSSYHQRPPCRYFCFCPAFYFTCLFIPASQILPSPVFPDLRNTWSTWWIDVEFETGRWHQDFWLKNQKGWNCIS